jgi:uncharacterized protein
VTSEAIALAQDPEVEEDLLVFSNEFDLPELIEDELLMSLPLVPRHETCPVDITMAVQDPDFEERAKAQRNPFTLLTQLKGDKNG